MGWCTAQWKMLLFWAKTIVKESRKFELPRLKKKILAVWRLLVRYFVMHFSTTGCVVRLKGGR